MFEEVDGIKVENKLKARPFIIGSVLMKKKQIFSLKVAPLLLSCGRYSVQLWRPPIIEI